MSDPKNSSATNRDALLAKGWKTTPSETPGNPERYVHSTLATHSVRFERALEIQRDKERTDAGLPLYFARPNPWGYGFEVIRQDGGGKRASGVCVARKGTLKEITDLMASYLAGNEPSAADLVDDTKYSRVLVFKEKHGARYFAATTIAEFHAACLKVVKERNEEVWYVFEDESDIQPPPLTEEQVSALREGATKSGAQEEWEAYRRQLETAKDDALAKKDLARALKGSGEAAAQFLRERSRGEYERMDLARLEEV
jgi:hypothetical protein